MKVFALALTRTLGRLCAVAVLCSATCLAYSQTSNPPDNGGYQVGETPPSDTRPGPPPQVASGIRVAKIDYVSGDVTWRPNADSNWIKAKKDTAINPGAQIWATGNAKAEVRFDDGGVARFSENAIATIDTMYADSQGNFTKIVMNSGLGYLTLKSSKAVYEADLPSAIAVASGPARVRLGADAHSIVAVHSGMAAVKNRQAKPQRQDVAAGIYASVSGPNSPVSVRPIPRPDGWDHWNDERDHVPTGYYAHSAVGGSIFVPVFIGGGFGPRWHRW